LLEVGHRLGSDFFMDESGIYFAKHSSAYHFGAVVG